MRAQVRVSLLDFSALRQRALKPSVNLVRRYAALAVMALPVLAPRFLASATGRFESNSNVFDLEFDSPPPGTNNNRRSDEFYAYGAQFDGDYLLGRQQIYVTANTTK